MFSKKGGTLKLSRKKRKSATKSKLPLFFTNFNKKQLISLVKKVKAFFFKIAASALQSCAGKIFVRILRYLLKLLKIPFIIFNSLLLTLLLIILLIKLSKAEFTNSLQYFKNKSKNCFDIAQYCVNGENLNIEFGKKSEINNSKRFIQFSVESFVLYKKNKKVFSANQTQLLFYFSDILKIKFVPVIKKLKGSYVVISGSKNKKSSKKQVTLRNTEEKISNITKVISKIIARNLYRSEDFSKNNIIEDVKVIVKLRQNQNVIKIDSINYSTEENTAQEVDGANIKYQFFGKMTYNDLPYEATMKCEQGITEDFFGECNFHLSSSANKGSELSITIDESSRDSHEINFKVLATKIGYISPQIPKIDSVNLDGRLNIKNYNFDLKSINIKANELGLNGRMSYIGKLFMLDLKSTWLTPGTHTKVLNLLKNKSVVKLINKNVAFSHIGEVKINRLMLQRYGKKMQNFILDTDIRNFETVVKVANNLHVKNISGHVGADMFGYAVNVKDAKVNKASVSAQVSGFTSPKSKLTKLSPKPVFITVKSNNILLRHLFGQDFTPQWFESLKDTIYMRAEALKGRVDIGLMISPYSVKNKYSLVGNFYVKHLQTLFNNDGFNSKIFVEKKFKDKGPYIKVDLKNSLLALNNRHIIKDKQSNSYILEMKIENSGPVFKMPFIKIHDPTSKAVLVHQSIAFDKHKKETSVDIKKINIFQNNLSGHVKFKKNAFLIGNIDVKQANATFISDAVALINLDQDSNSIDWENFKFDLKIKGKKMEMLNDVNFIDFDADIQLNDLYVGNSSFKGTASKEFVYRNLSGNLTLLSWLGNLELGCFDSGNRNYAISLQTNNSRLFLEAFGLISYFQNFAGGNFTFSGEQNMDRSVSGSFALKNSFFSEYKYFNGVVEEVVSNDVFYNVRKFVSKSSNKTKGMIVQNINSDIEFSYPDLTIGWNDLVVDAGFVQAFDNFGMYNFDNSMITIGGSVSFKPLNQKNDYFAYDSVPLVGKTWRNNSKKNNNGFINVKYQSSNVHISELTDNLEFSVSNIMSGLAAGKIDKILRQKK